MWKEYIISFSEGPKGPKPSREVLNISFSKGRLTGHKNFNQALFLKKRHGKVWLGSA
jgi:hypothetical protein